MKPGEHLRVNPVLCDAYGHCAELLPQLISRDDWGYPMLPSTPVPEHLLGEARRAVRACPKLALLLEATSEPGSRR
jgi:ferredoxin